MPDSTATRWRKVRWAAAIIALAVATGLALALFQAHRPFKVPGPEAKVLSALSQWAKAVGLKNAGFKLFHLGEIIDNRRVESALRSGKLVRVTLPFNGNRMAPREITARVLEFGRLNGIQVVSAIASQRTSIDPIMTQSIYDVGKSNGFEFVSTRFPPDDVQLIVESKGRARMEAFVRRLNIVRAHSSTDQNTR